MSNVVERFNQQHSGKARAFLPAHPFYETWCRIGDPTVPVGHADSFTTSIALYLRPGSVRLDQISNPHSGTVDWQDPHLDFANYTTSGVIGDPTHASAELGEKLWKAVVEQTGRTLKDVAGSEV